MKKYKALFFCFFVLTMVGCATPLPPPKKLPNQPVESFDSIFPSFISKLQNKLGYKPRVKFIGVTMEPRFGYYAEGCLKNILSVSKKIYPLEIHGMQGETQQLIAILPSGEIPLVGLQKSSGSNLLDQALVYFIYQASPCDAFPEDVKSDTDLIVLVRTFVFTNTNTLLDEGKETFWKPKGQ